MTENAKLFSEEQANTGRNFNADRFFYKYVKPLLEAPQEGRNKLVDLGCGAGEMSAYARDLGYEVTALDVSESNVETLKKLGFPAQVADLNHPFDLPSDAFDVAVLVEVIEHVVNTDLLLGEIARVLKPGGKLLVSTPNHAYYGNRFAALLGKPPKEEGYHFRFFTQKLLEKKLGKAGFKVVRRNSFNMDHILNQISKRILHKRIQWGVPKKLEPLHAHTFVYLAELQRKPETSKQ